MNDGTSAPRCCEACGGPIRPDNKEDVCSRTPVCHRIRMKKRREAVKPPPEKKVCKICGEPLRSRNRSGICGSKKRPACRNAAKRQIRKDRAWQAYSLAIKAGDTFSRWTALEDYGPDNKAILVRCECGTERRVRGAALNGGFSQSCGRCVRGPDPSHEPYLLAGSTYGRLTVLEDVTYNSQRARCQCACGSPETTIIATSVKLGLTKSCGCLQRDTRITHGFTGHPLAQTWRGMIRRCTDPRDPAYYNYGGRGIAVCDRWMDPWAFAEDIYREIGPRPEGVSKSGRALYSLDRYPDNDGPYAPGNVRWSTTSQQVTNQRKVAKMTLEIRALTQERDALAAELAALKAS